MVTVEADVDEVERRLAAGELSCPACSGVLAGWGWARPRQLRGPDGPVWLCPRRSRCTGCGVTHVLLPVAALLRRADVAAVIVAGVGGQGGAQGGVSPDRGRVGPPGGDGAGLAAPLRRACRGGAVGVHGVAACGGCRSGDA